MDINNRIVTTYMARAGNALAVLGQVEASMLRGGRAAGYQTRQLGAMEQQMRALGTTIRYALAGGLVFGITGLIGKLNQLQQQLGLIQAIAPTAGVNFNSSNIGQFLNQIEQRAPDARTSITDLNNSVINFLSTVQGAPKNEIADIVAQIGITAKLSQTPTEDLTKAVSTLNIAAGRTNNLENINALLREWFQLISTAPGGIAAAPQIAQQLGPLAAVARMGRLTPEQLFGFSLGALRFGATPSTALRGSQYFLQSLFQPGKGQAKVLSAAGFTPQRLSQEGGAKFVIDYLNYVRRLGGGNANKMQLTQFGNAVDLNPDTEAALEPNQNIPGYSPQALQFLRNTIGRIHGIRTAAVLIAQLERKGQIASITDDIQTMNDLWKGEGKDVNNLKKAIKRYRDATPLQGAAIALNTISTQAQTALSPVLNPISGGIQKIGQTAANHPEATRHIIQGGAAFLAALGLSRLAGLRGRSLMGAIRGGGGILGRGYVTTKAIEDLAAGGTQLGATPANPVYVTVVGQIFGGQGTGGGGGGPTGGGGKKLPPVVVGGLRGLTGLTGAELGVAGFTIAAVLASAGAGNEREQMKNTLDRLKSFPQIRNAYMKAQLKGTKSLSPAEHQAFELYSKHGPGSAEAFLNVARGRVPLSVLPKQMQSEFSPLLRKVAMDNAMNQVNFVNGLLLQALKPLMTMKSTKLEGGVDLNIKVTDGSGKSKDARVHVPLSVVHQGGSVPSSRGKRKSARVDFTVGGTSIRVGGKP